MEPLNLEQQKKVARLYRKMEPTLKSRVRYHARKWNQQADDMEGAMREAFVKALSDYKPDFGTAEESLVHTYVNLKLSHEGRALYRAKRLFDNDGSHLDVTEWTADRNPSNTVFEKAKERIFAENLTANELLFLQKLEEGHKGGELRKNPKFNWYNQAKMLPKIQAIAMRHLL